MGLALWIICGLAAFFLARIIPQGRRRSWLGEWLTALASAMSLGIVATALDFGGWRELEWRAGLFVFFGALALLGVFRLVTFPHDSPLK